MSSFFPIFAAALLASTPALAGGPQPADPTRPAGGPAVIAPIGAQKKQPLFLSSLLISPQRRIAIINGKSLSEGERIAGERILSITDTGVQLEGSRGVYTLSLHPKPVKRRAESEGTDGDG